MPANVQVRLAQRPDGVPTADTWSIESHPVSEPQEGQIIVRILYISLDPAMRGWIRNTRSYIPPVELGAVMRAGAVGRVEVSLHPEFEVGDYVMGQFGVQEYAISDGNGVYKIDPSKAALPMYLSVLGMTGFTAYFGLLRIGEPKEGDTVLVSGAAGAVGSIVGQIAKLKGCRVIGIAGGPEKCQYLMEELGFDGAIDYKTGNLASDLKTHCPKGIDVYFDNVGGDILDLALTRINRHARIVICGAISQYNNTGPIKGPKNYLALLVQRARMEGFVIFDFAKDYGKAASEMGQWLAEGKLKSKEYIVQDIKQFNQHFLRLFSGEKLGKLVLQVGE